MRGRQAARRLAAAALLLLTVPAPARAQATEAPIPVEAFAEIPFLTDALLSPDGTRIAARVMNDGRNWIGVWTLSAPRDQQPQLVPGSGVESFSWAGNDRLLLIRSQIALRSLGYAIQLTPSRQISTHELTENKTTTLRVENSVLHDIVFTDRFGRYVLVSTLTGDSQFPGVHRTDLATGEAVLLQRPERGVWTWFADNEGYVRVGIDYGERRTRIFYRATPTGPLARLETRQDLLDDSVVDGVRLLSGQGRGILSTNAVTGRFGIYEYDFTTATRGSPLFEHPEVDALGLVPGPDGGIDGFLFEDDRLRARWLNPDMVQLQDRLDSALPNRTNLVVNRSLDGNRVLVFSGSADDPGTYYVFDRAARRLEVFASPYEGLVGRPLAPVRPVAYRSRDGLTIRGYLTLPRGAAERGLPLVVLPHGGPFLRDSWNFHPDAQFLASRGYAVLQPNFRGSTGYGRDFVERGYGQLGGGMIDDIDDGVDWLAQEGIVDPARVCIMGASYGGYAAIWGAMRSPQRYRCAISWAGPTDLAEMMRRDSRYIFASRYVRERRRQLRGEESINLRDISPVRFPERLQVPLLIAHGDQDETVPVSQSRELLRVLTRRSAPVESVFYPKAGHDFTTSEDSADFFRRVETFLQRHNPARTTPPAATAPDEAAGGLR